MAYSMLTSDVHLGLDHIESEQSTVTHKLLPSLKQLKFYATFLHKSSTMTATEFNFGVISYLRNWKHVKMNFNLENDKT